MNSDHCFQIQSTCLVVDLDRKIFRVSASWIITFATYYLLSPALSIAQDHRAKFEYVVHGGLHFSPTDESLTLDLFVPKTDASIPCIIVIQGGGFLGQNGQRFRPVAQYIAENGMAAALTSYRGRPNYTYIETIADAKAAVRYVRTESKRYGINAMQIGAMGRSAGGTLASLLAVTADSPEFQVVEEAPPTSDRIQAAVAFAGVFDFVARFTDTRQLALQPNHVLKKQTNGEWLDEPFATNAKGWKLASAINHLDSSDAPMLLVHCKDDATVPWLQSQAMHDRMQEKGVVGEVRYFEIGGHGFKDVNEAGNELMIEFFRDIFSKQH
ncbi:MAG: alpha/beta hydrolase [Planctomycetales bacterium]|nr:alpha/beta hydrolase [Planctomycetales bacterium]